MKEVIDNTVKLLKDLAGNNYADEDWGQLDYYSPNFPVKWPCTLVDVTSAQYDHIGRDRKAVPQNRQMASGPITITFANLKLSHTSGRAPQSQKDNAWSIIGLIEDGHKMLQGFKPAENASALLRSSHQRVKRDDGVQEYKVTYEFELTNV